MSGLYAIVWSDDDKDEKVLLKTKGGYPHITLRYFGDEIDRAGLQKLAIKHFAELTDLAITISGVRLNSFETGGVMRHDVLLELDEESTELIEGVRATLPKAKYPDVAAHVTHKICATREEAERTAKEVEKLMPLTCDITGLTID